MNPQATGGAGHNFEQHVDAAFLALLLCGGACPFLMDGIVICVHLQSGHLGWQTDDLLIETSTGLGTVKAAIQVKQSFTLSENDEDCVATVQRAYQDFTNQALFNPGCDRLGLIIGLESKKLLHGLRTLLDCARSSMSGEDLARRLAIPRYLGQIPKSYFDAICAIIRSANPPATDEDIWHFLRVFDFASLDLNTSGSVTENMLRGLLRSTASDVMQADATWGELLQLTTGGSGSAKSIRRDQLPCVLLQRHNSLGAAHSEAFMRLMQDTRIVVERVTTTIAGDVELPRAELVQQLIEQLATDHVVLVTGEAGVGKSVVAKQVFRAISEGCLGLAYRAESLAKPHINEALFTQQLNLDRLKEYLALHQRKIIWVESLERILERPDRDAFKDLLRSVKTDPSLLLLITCRQYSADTIRTAFFDDAGIPCSVFEVEGLAESDLNEVSAKKTKLARPLSEPRLRDLLKNPFYLNQASVLDWPDTEPLPKTEREFRQKFWNDRVRANAERDVAGMPERRGRVLIEVARKRAVALRPYIDGSGLSEDAIDRLLRDSILTSPSGEASQLAPAHDVIEDWALLHWIETEYQTHVFDRRNFFDAIGTFPAVRRAYRRWLREAVTIGTKTGDEFLGEFIRDTSIPQHWQDDTLLSILESSEAGDFLHRNGSTLIAGDGNLLRRVIHLLRIAAKIAIPAEKLGGKEGHVLWPKGDGWAATAELILTVLPSLTKKDLPLILGFMEDWASIPHYIVPYPKGSRAIVKIVLHMLPLTANYDRHDCDHHSRLLKLLLRIPKADEASLTRLIESKLIEGRMTEGDILDLICHLYGGCLARDLPDLYIRIVEHIFGMNIPIEEAMTHSDYYSMASTNFEFASTFGLPCNLGFGGFPPSAYHGPFWQLLQHHPELGIELAIRLLNRCCDAYGYSHNPYRAIEPPERIKITLPDGREHEQWANYRLWGLYRSAMPGPDYLESTLMALERWLLDIAKQEPKRLPDLLLRLLEQSNNVAITAVVASVAASAPNHAGPGAVALLTQPIFFWWDLQRKIHDDSGALQTIADMMPSFRADGMLYNAERKEAGALPHRKKQLEDLARELQLTDQQEKVFEVIDWHISELPPIEEQDEGIRLWRLCLHRIDLRGYKSTNQVVEGGIVFRPGPPAPDIQELIDTHQPHSEKFFQQTNLLMWGINAFEGRNTDRYDPSSWHEILSKALTQLGGPSMLGHGFLNDYVTSDVTPPESFSSEERIARSGPEYIVVVCIRDHWDELTDDEKKWCSLVTLRAVERESNTQRCGIRVEQNSMDGSRPAAFILPALFNKQIPDITPDMLLAGLTSAILHVNDEVCAYAAQGCSVYLWSIDRELVISCASALIQFSHEFNRHLLELRSIPWHMRDQKAGQEDTWVKLKQQAREGIKRRESFSDADFKQLDLSHDMDNSTLGQILFLFERHTEDSLARAFMAKAVDRLAEMWRLDRDARSQRSRRQDRESPQFDFNLQWVLVYRIVTHLFVLHPEDAVSLAKPLADLIYENPRRIVDFLRHLVSVQDTSSKNPSFWAVWQLFANFFISLECFKYVDREYSDDRNVLGVLLLSEGWKDEARSWLPLVGEEHRVVTFFERLPASESSFEAYLRFLTFIGAPTLPDSLVPLAEKISGRVHDMNLSDSTRFYLEKVLSRLIFGGNSRIRREDNLRASVITLLDAGVNSGSSLCYRLRDDFLTPWSE